MPTFCTHTHSAHIQLLHVYTKCAYTCCTHMHFAHINTLHVLTKCVYTCCTHTHFARVHTCACLRDQGLHVSRDGIIVKIRCKDSDLVDNLQIYLSYLYTAIHNVCIYSHVSYAVFIYGSGQPYMCVNEHFTRSEGCARTHLHKFAPKMADLLDIKITHTHSHSRKQK